jgi:hypothetical protein
MDVFSAKMVACLIFINHIMQIINRLSHLAWCRLRVVTCNTYINEM